LVRIFVVDDSATARAALKSALEGRADWVVVGEAVDGHHALATFHLHTPHLTLMDFIMSKMNGLDTARHLTARHPDILILDDFCCSSDFVSSRPREICFARTDKND
jgi:CheY-like chemotaxis protein